MLPTDYLLVGGIFCIIISISGSILNFVTLFILISNVSFQKNSTSILIIFLLISNLIYSLVVLPLNSIALLYPTYLQNHLIQCSLFALLYFWNFASLLFLQAVLAINRASVVLSTSLRYLRIYSSTPLEMSLGSHLLWVFLLDSVVGLYLLWFYPFQWLWMAGASLGGTKDQVKFIFLSLLTQCN